MILFIVVVVVVWRRVFVSLGQRRQGPERGPVHPEMNTPGIDCRFLLLVLCTLVQWRSEVSIKVTILRSGPRTNRSARYEGAVGCWMELQTASKL